MRLSARVDYALRAVAELAALTAVREAAADPPAAAVDDALRVPVGAARVPAGAATVPIRRTVTAEQIARAQEIPPKFLESILLQLRRGGVVHAQRGPEGGYWLARPAADISLAEVIRVVDGPLAHIRGQRPEELGYRGTAKALQEVWIALRASERQILEQVSIADIAAGALPDRVRDLAADPDAWV